jgi:hypothetical protein
MPTCRILADRILAADLVREAQLVHEGCRAIIGPTAAISMRECS